MREFLRVFFVGTERVDGTIGAEKAAWPGRAVWSDRLDEPRLASLPKGLAPANAWLTMFGA